MSVREALVEVSKETLVAAYNGFGQRLFQAVAGEPGNIVLSPYSIGTAMAMALAGARGDTALEIALLLGLPVSGEQIAREQTNSANAALLAGLCTGPSESFQLSIANALMLTSTTGPISDDYVALLREQYAAQLFRNVDLATINDWVRRKTNGRIDSILDSIDVVTPLVLLNAVYFKGRWQNEFEARTTTFCSPGGDVMVSMMYRCDQFALARRPGYRAIRLPYAAARFAMIVLLPDVDLGNVERRLDLRELRSLLTALAGKTSSVSLWLPRFRASFGADLTRRFAFMGMRRARNLTMADFSGITGQPPSDFPLAIGAIMHRAVIDVTEKGTEAAAETAISIRMWAEEEPVGEPFCVDRPFLFFIVDDASGAVLFQGRIVDPRQGPVPVVRRALAETGRSFGQPGRQSAKESAELRASSPTQGSNMLVWKLALDHWPGKSTDIQWVALNGAFEVAYIRQQKFSDNGPAYSWWFAPREGGLPDVHNVHTAEECKRLIEITWRAMQKPPRRFV